jgi:cell division protein FtsI/penicillin-binding protein 2
MKNIGIDPHIEDATKAIHKAKIIKDTPKESLTKKSLAKKILAKKQVIHPKDIEELSKIMQKVIVSTDKAMKGTKVTKNKTESKWIEVKKETAEIINHTRNAKYAAMASKKSANAALATAKK